jgi:phosphate transport system substrate-binding protein
MGTFASNVSDETSVDGSKAASQTEIITAGSTSVQPLSDVLAKYYMKANQGVKISVSGGGSGVGKTAAGLDNVDLGAASSALTDTEKATYPDLIQHEIGGSAVVVVVSDELNATMTSATLAGLKGIYANVIQNGTNTGKTYWNDAPGNNKILEAHECTAGGSGTLITVLQREEESGTETEFGKAIGFTIDTSSAVKKAGNAGMKQAIASATTETLGFLDFGFVDTYAAGATVCQVTVEGSYPDKSNIVTTLKGQTGGYPTGLVKHLYYLTYGQPSALEQAFIDFAKAPSSRAYHTEAGTISIYDYM